MTVYKDKTRLFTDEVWNKRNFQVFEETIHPQFQYHDPAYPHIKSKQDYRAFIARIQKTSPDMQYDMLDVIAEDTKVVVLYAWRGTPVVKIAGVLPTGQLLEHHGIAIYYFENHYVIKIWDIWDRYSLLKQLKTR